jgi:hypothetical protein
MRAARALPAVLLTSALALTACGTDEQAAAPVPTVSATTAAPGEPAETASPQPEVTPDDAQVVGITVAGGEVSGVEPRTVVRVGTTVRLTITSDVVDEVHVHGYELSQPVPAGQAMTLEFVADRPGVFEVELHDAGTVLTRLQVQ